MVCEVYKFNLKMESVTKNINTRPIQFEMLVDYLSTHTDLAKGYLKTADARRKSFCLWESLAKDLNAEGPPMRDGVGWKKVWADFKVHTKAKIRKNKISVSGTGGGPSKHRALSSLEERVIELLDLNEAVGGMTDSLSFGANKSLEELPTATSQLSNIEAVENELPSYSGRDTFIESRSTNNPKNRRCLLEKQVAHQIEFQKKSLEIFGKMNDSIETVAKYKRRSFVLKEKSLEMMKDKLQIEKDKLLIKTEKFEFKKTNALQKTKDRIKKLELKREILTLQQACNALPISQDENHSDETN